MNEVVKDARVLVEYIESLGKGLTKHSLYEVLKKYDEKLSAFEESVKMIKKRRALENQNIAQHLDHLREIAIEYERTWWRIYGVEELLLTTNLNNSAPSVVEAESKALKESLQPLEEKLNAIKTVLEQHDNT